MTSPGGCVFRGLFFVLREQVYLAVNKSNLTRSQARSSKQKTKLTESQFQ